MKKLFVYTFLLFVAIAASAQKVKPVQYGGMCEYLSTDDGPNQVFTVKVNGYGKNDALAMEDAEIRVVRMVLYTGMPGQCKALLTQETAELDNFIDQKQYKNYILNTTKQTPLIKDKGAKTSKGLFHIKINVGGLDKYLHQAGLKRFGF